MRCFVLSWIFLGQANLSFVSSVASVVMLIDQAQAYGRVRRAPSAYTKDRS